MRIGLSLLLIALGAVLFWGVTVEGEGFNLNIIGIILMAVGAVGLLISLFLGVGRDRAIEERTVVHRDDDVI